MEDQTTALQFPFYIHLQKYKKMAEVAKTPCPDTHSLPPPQKKIRKSSVEGN